MTIVDDILSALGLSDSKSANDSSRQLEQAQREQAQRRVTPEMEKEAKAKGFKNYEAYLQWQKQRANQTGGTTQGNVRVPQTAQEAVPAWHPSVLLGYVNDAIENAKKKRN